MINSNILTAGILCWALICAPGYANAKTIEDKKIPVETHRTGVKEWHTEMALTVDGIVGFKSKKEPKKDKYGGWMTANLGATGFFRVQQHDGRWWMITPEGHPFICKAVAGLKNGTSHNQQSKAKQIFGSKEEWAKHEYANLKANGFNAAGAWSDTDFILNAAQKIPYCVIISPLKSFEKKHYSEFKNSRNAFVFGSELETAVKERMKKAAIYKDDPWCIGYFIDNEIPWKASNLDCYLDELPADDPNHIAAKQWLSAKGKTRNELNPRDLQEFAASLLDHYLGMAVKYLKEQDPNHMILGCRFNVWKDELSNPAIFKVAGKYMDVISVNHYNYWEPWFRRFDKWEEWSGKPIMVTEFYTKGEDSGMENNTGGGWIVHTQKDRGLFYQNFVINLMKSRACVGWQFFKYQDNDPADLKADPSNRNSNKGIVNSDFAWYKGMTDEMKKVNTQSWNIIRHYLHTPQKPTVCIIDDDFRKGEVEVAKHIFDSLGIKATFAIIPTEKDGAYAHSSWQKTTMKQWINEGHTFAMHPPHQGWYNSPTAGTFKSVGHCEESIKNSITAFKKGNVRNVTDILVYPGSSGSNNEVVKMAGKYVRYGIGAAKNGPKDGMPVQFTRLFIQPGKGTVEDYKDKIKSRLETDGFVFLGMHSCQFKKSDYPMLIEILEYAKSLAEFKLVTDAVYVYGE